MRGWEYEGWGQDGGGESNERDVLMGGSLGLRRILMPDKLPGNPKDDPS